jgi:hypothetical protein
MIGSGIDRRRLTHWKQDECHGLLCKVGGAQGCVGVAPDSTREVHSEDEEAEQAQETTLKRQPE